MAQDFECPWNVESLEDFLYYCCPECNARNQSREDFLNHALDQHPTSKNYLTEIKVKKEFHDTRNYHDSGVANLAISVTEHEKEDLLMKIKEENINPDEYYDENFMEDEIQDDYDEMAEFKDENEDEDYVNEDEDYEMDENKKRCDTCGKNFVSASTLKTHVQRVHLGIRNFKCEQCDKKFKSNSALEYHLTFIHGDEETKAGLKSYKCDQCEYAATQPIHLTQHINSVHEKLKPFQCDQCNHKSASRSSLKSHISQVHDGVKPFKCDQCDYAAGHRSSLRDHIKYVHEGQKRPKFPCDLCQKSFYMPIILNLILMDFTNN